jgi:hypothetical protein
MYYSNRYTFNSLVSEYDNEIKKYNRMYESTYLDDLMNDMSYETTLLLEDGDNVDTSPSNPIGKKRNIIMRIIDTIIGFIQRVFSDIKKIFDRKVEEDFNKAADGNVEMNKNYDKTLDECESTFSKVVDFLKPGFTKTDENGDKKFSPIKAAVTAIETAAVAGGAFVIGKKALPKIKERASKYLENCEKLLSNLKKKSFNDKALEILRDKNKSDAERLKAAKTLAKDDPELMGHVNAIEKRIKENSVSEGELKSTMKTMSKDYEKRIMGMAKDGKNWNKKPDAKNNDAGKSIVKKNGGNKENFFMKLFGLCSKSAISEMNDHQVAAHAISQSSKYAASVLKDTVQAMMKFVTGNNKPNKSGKSDKSMNESGYYDFFESFEVSKTYNEYNHDSFIDEIDSDINAMLTNL